VQHHLVTYLCVPPRHCACLVPARAKNSSLGKEVLDSAVHRLSLPGELPMLRPVMPLRPSPVLLDLSQFHCPPGCPVTKMPRHRPHTLLPLAPSSVQSHNQCVTEHEKYAQGVTKAGGYAAQGFFNDKAPAAGAAGGAGAGEPKGTQFLSSRPPWKCSICNVTCTSQDTLLGHAAGAKHKRRVRGAGIKGLCANLWALWLSTPAAAYWGVLQRSAALPCCSAVQPCLLGYLSGLWARCGALPAFPPSRICGAPAVRLGTLGSMPGTINQLTYSRYGALHGQHEGWPA
jgi:hypothetical protein